MGFRCSVVNLTKKQSVERDDDCWKGDVQHQTRQGASDVPEFQSCHGQL